MKIFKKDTKIDDDYIKISDIPKEDADFIKQSQDTFWNLFLSLTEVLKFHRYNPMDTIKSMCDNYKKGNNNIKIYIPKKLKNPGKDPLLSNMSEKEKADYYESVYISPEDFIKQSQQTFWHLFLSLTKYLELHGYNPMDTIKSMCDNYKKNEKESIQ